jgi:hypothetical protein
MDYVGGRSEGSSPQVSQRRTLGFNNFLIVSFLYLINLALIWLKNTRSIDWDILAISPFVLYLTSVMLGIWGFRRLIQQQEAVSFRDSGAYLYAGLALVTTLTMAYAFVTANDPLVELFEDVIVYTHLAMGLVFCRLCRHKFSAYLPAEPARLSNSLQTQTARIKPVSDSRCSRCRCFAGIGRADHIPAGSGWLLQWAG